MIQEAFETNCMQFLSGKCKMSEDLMCLWIVMVENCRIGQILNELIPRDIGGQKSNAKLTHDCEFPGFTLKSDEMGQCSGLTQFLSAFSCSLVKGES